MKLTGRGGSGIDEYGVVKLNGRNVLSSTERLVVAVAHWKGGAVLYSSVTEPLGKVKAV